MQTVPSIEKVNPRMQQKQSSSNPIDYHGLPSIPHAFLVHADKRPQAVAARIKKGDAYQDITWAAMTEQVESIALGLLDLGILPHTQICILSNTSLNWASADLGIVSIACVTVPIYQSNTADECAYVINDSKSCAIFVEDLKQYEKIKQVRHLIPELKHIIMFSGAPSPDGDYILLDTLKQRGREQQAKRSNEYKNRLHSLTPDSLLTIIYTSGTTGAPKGALITHGCMLYQAIAGSQIDLVRPEDDQLTFLPLAHVLAKQLECLWFYLGHTMSFAESVDKLVQNMAEAKPTIMVAVPRIYEKVYAKIISGGIESGGIKALLFKWAMNVEARVSHLESNHTPLNGLLEIEWKLAQKLVFSKIADKLKALFGGRLRYFVSGGAPLAPKIAYFFRHANVNILEGYGMTESSGGNCINRLHFNKIGTVGQVFPGTEIRIAEDGEILIKGPCLMTGYYNKPQATEDTLVNGWLHTGDIGEIDSDGCLKITDRKKDIIVTASGKKVPPQEIENTLKTYPLLSQAIVLGDKMKYLVALVTLNQEGAAKIVSNQGGQEQDPARLAAHPAVKDAVSKIIDMYNAKVASFEQIKRFAIVAQDFTQEGGELTPSLKVKRKVVTEKYKDIIATLYES